jgi:L-arabinose isomerase
MPYIFFQPDSGAATLARSWLEAGGTHHETVVYGEHRARIRLLAQLLGIEYLELNSENDLEMSRNRRPFITESASGTGG